jgi:hypothetical protein
MGSGASSATHFEILVRSILLRPDHPALIILGHFAPQTNAKHGFTRSRSVSYPSCPIPQDPCISTEGLYTLTMFTIQVVNILF